MEVLVPLVLVVVVFVVASTCNFSVLDVSCRILDLLLPFPSSLDLWMRGTSTSDFVRKLQLDFVVQASCPFPPCPTSAESLLPSEVSWPTSLVLPGGERVAREEEEKERE